MVPQTAKLEVLMDAGKSDTRQRSAMSRGDGPSDHTISFGLLSGRGIGEK